MKYDICGFLENLSTVFNFD